MPIERALREVSEAVRARVPALSRTIRERIIDDVADYFVSQDPLLYEVLDGSIAGALRDILDGLARGRTLPASAPSEALEEARLAAQAEADLHGLLRHYRIGQVIFWDAIMEEAERLIADPAVRVPVLRLASSYQFAWNDRVTAEVIQVYQQERDALCRSRERRVRETVRDLLAGLPVDPDRLGYDLRTEHVALIAWGSAPDQIVADLAGSAQARVLSLAGTGGTTIAWLGRQGLADERRAVGARYEAPEGSCVAIGEAALGEEGFRVSPRQATHAYRVARLSGKPVTLYRQVALEALVTPSLQAARDFVEHELGTITDDDPRAAVLRATLRAYFATGQNAASAGHLLGVHERTVSYRLRSIEQRLGVSIATRRDELAVALRLDELLGRSPAGGQVREVVDVLADGARL